MVADRAWRGTWPRCAINVHDDIVSDRQWRSKLFGSNSPQATAPCKYTVLVLQSRVMVYICKCDPTPNGSNCSAMSRPNSHQIFRSYHSLCSLLVFYALQRQPYVLSRVLSGDRQNKVGGVQARTARGQEGISHHAQPSGRRPV